MRDLPRASAGLEHHAQDAVDAESRVPEAGVGVGSLSLRLARVHGGIDLRRSLEL